MAQRFTLTASSLGNYFGVGFISPMEQLEIDLGNKERKFFKNQEDSMSLGNFMENAMLDYFEHKLGIEITERNERVYEVIDGLLRCKIDGRTEYDGIPTTVEEKFTTGADSFVNDLGYYLQCQAYMIEGDEQTLLLGAHNGRPDMKLIKKDESVGNDIKEMVYAVSAILSGFSGKDTFPYHLVEKWSGVGILPDLTEDMIDINDVKRYTELSASIKDMETERDEIAERLKNSCDKGQINTSYGKITISYGSRKGSLDEQLLRMTLPHIDFEAMRKPSSQYKTIRITKAKE